MITLVVSRSTFSSIEMALSTEKDTAQIVSSTQQQATVVSHVGGLLDVDPHSQLFFESPPPDVVSSINECFELLNNTVEERNDASMHKPCSDSDSGESLFLTQSVTKAVRTERRRRSTNRSDSGDETEGVTRTLSENQDTEYEEGSRRPCALRRKKGIRDLYAPPKKATFPFLMKSLRQQHLPSKKHQILENSEIGGFFKCIKKIEEGYDRMTERAISPCMLESEISDNSEEGEHNSDHEVTIVDKTFFVPGYYKGNKLEWLPQHIIDKREKQVLNPIGKEKKRKTTSTKKQMPSASIKKQLEKKLQVPKRKAPARTLSESSNSFSEEQEKQHEVLASCSEDEHSDSAQYTQPLTKQIVQSAENPYEDHLVVVEETQRNTLEEVTEAVAHTNHEDDTSSRTQPENNQPKESNFILPPQEGDTSLQNDIQEKDCDIGSVDLISPLNSPKHNNCIHEPASITDNMEEGDEDSDVTLIETEAEFESIFGPGTQRWYEGECHANEDDDSNMTQIETGGENMSATPNKQFIDQDVNNTKNPESQKMVPSSDQTEELSRGEGKQRETMSHNDTEVTGVEENVQPSSKHSPLVDEPLTKDYSSSCSNGIVGRKKAMVEMETNTPDSPLFKNNGLSFLKRKKKKKEKMGAIDDNPNADVGQTVSSETQEDDITGPKTARKENAESCEAENRITHAEQTETSEVLDENVLSTVIDNSNITKRNSMKKNKLKELEDVETGVEKQLVQFSESQTSELTTKRTKKKQKDKEGTNPSYAEENRFTDTPSNETLHSNRPAKMRANEGNQSNEAPYTEQPQHIEISEEISGCSPDVLRLKSAKKKKKKKEDEHHYESIALDVTSVSQFEVSPKVADQEDQATEERQGDQHLQGKNLKVSKHKKKSHTAGSQANDIIALEKQKLDSQSENAAELSHLGSDSIIMAKDKKKKNKTKDEHQYESVELDVSSVSQFDVGLKVVEQQEDQHLKGKTLKVSKHKKKGHTTGSQAVDIIGQEKQKSDSQSESAAELSHLGSDGIVIAKDKKKKKKRKLKERNDSELASDLEGNVQLFQHNKSQTTDLLSRKKKKKIASIDGERTTVSSSDEHLEHMDHRAPEMRGSIIQSTETNQLEHLPPSEEITRSPSPSVTRLSSGKKKKKKKDRSDYECLYESVDLNLDVSSVSQFHDVTGQEDGVSTQNMTEERQNEDNTVENLHGNAAHVLKVAKRKKKPRKVGSPSQVDDIIGLGNMSDLQSGNTVELEEINLSVLSDTMFTSKQKKKKKHKLKEPDVAEPNADALSVVKVHYVESDQFNEPQTAEQIPRRTKKKKKDKERTKIAYVEETGDILANENFEASQTDQLEHIQIPEEITHSLNVTTSKSAKKKKKKKRHENEESQNESVDPDGDSVCQFDSSTQKTIGERPSDVEYKKKRKRSSFSIIDASDLSSSTVQLQEPEMPERRKKKKKKSKSYCVTNAGRESALESSDCTTHFEKPQSLMLKSRETVLKKPKGKKNKEINAYSAELKITPTKRTDTVNADSFITSLADSADSRKKKKKKKRKKTDLENMEEISMPQDTVVNGDTPKRCKKQRCHD